MFYRLTPLSDFKVTSQVRIVFTWEVLLRGNTIDRGLLRRRLVCSSAGFWFVF